MGSGRGIPQLFQKSVSFAYQVLRLILSLDRIGDIWMDVAASGKTLRESWSWLWNLNRLGNILVKNGDSDPQLLLGFGSTIELLID